MACADINRQNGRRMWHDIGTDDNHGIIYRNGAELSKFHGDMLNTDAGAGVSQNNGHWYIVGYDDYSYEKPELLLRRGPSEAVNTFSAKVDFNWVMRNNKDGQSPYEEDLRQVTGDIDIDTEKINIRNDVTLYGGVFKLSPLAFPNAWWMSGRAAMSAVSYYPMGQRSRTVFLEGLRWRQPDVGLQALSR